MAILADIKKIHTRVDLQGVVHVAPSLKGCCVLVALVGNQTLLPLDCHRTAGREVQEPK